MALPTTNLTLHLDGSVVTDLWQAKAPFATHPADNGAVTYWDDVEHADIVAGTMGDDPLWRSGTPLMANPCVDFDGTNDFLKIFADDGTTAKTFGNIMAVGAYTVLVSFYVENVVSNTTNPEDNEAILNDTFGYWGLYLSKPSGYKVHSFNYDTARTSINFDINLNTSYVLMTRHESGTLYASLNGGSESSTTSGNTGNIGGSMLLGKNGVFSRFFNGRIGELAVYNAALTGSNLTDAVSYFTAKWLPVVGRVTKNTRAFPLGMEVGMNWRGDI